jgi:uncharacterized protein YkwD
MLKKQVVASILATALTFFSGSLTFASAATSIPQSTNPTLKADLCSGLFASALCGKIEDICFPTKNDITVPDSYTTLPQKLANGLYTITTSNGEGSSNQKPRFSYSYDIAVATPTTAPLPTTTVSPSPTVAVQAAVAYNTPTVTTPPTGEGLNPEVIFSMINQIRVQNGLAPLEKSPEVCAITESRAPELYNEIFVNGNMHAGFARRQPDIKYWMTENMIHQNTEQQAVSWWMNSPIHRSAILGNYTHSCVSCQGNSCSMIFTSFVAK